MKILGSISENQNPLRVENIKTYALDSIKPRQTCLQDNLAEI